MPLCSKVKVEMPKTGVFPRRSGKYHTVFKVLRTFINAKGQSASERVAIGKLDPDTGMLIPNDKYWEYYSPVQDLIQVEPEYGSNRSVGGAYLFSRVAGRLGVAGLLDECLGETRGALVRTAALHMIARGNVFERVLEYCEGYTLTEPPLTSQSASELFSSITDDERMAFFKGWVARQAVGRFLAYDVTSFSTYAKGVVIDEWGYNRDGDRLPQINFGFFLSQDTRLPLFYVTYPGSIVDKSHLPYMMAYNEDLGIKDVCFVMDRGFCSTGNLRHMSKEGLGFVMSVEIRHKTTRGAIDCVRSGLPSFRNKVDKTVYGMAVPGHYYGVDATMHVFYDPGLAESHKRDLERGVEADEERLAQLRQLTSREAKRYRKRFLIDLRKDGSFTYARDYDKLDDLAVNFGFFCVLTNTGLDSAAVLSVYRDRDAIEKGIDDLKNHVDMRRMRTHNQATMDGKMFCAFIALIVASQIGVKLERFMGRKSWSKDHVVAEMEKIRVVTGTGGVRLANPVTKTQRAIMEALGLKEDDLVAYVNGDLSDSLILCQ
jgi:transposase